MLEFYRTYLLPSSTTRARLSVHLHARGAAERALKIAKALESSGLSDVPEGSRQSIEQLEAYLQKNKLDDEKLAAIVSEVKELGLVQKAPVIENGAEVDGPSAVETAVEIEDVRRYKASLPASSGPRAFKDVSEFEETDPKL